MLIRAQKVSNEGTHSLYFKLFQIPLVIPNMASNELWQNSPQHPHLCWTKKYIIINSFFQIVMSSRTSLLSALIFILFFRIPLSLDLILSESDKFGQPAGLGFITSITFIFLVGVFMSSWLGASLLSLGEWFIKKMPLVSYIYSASKQISAAISPGKCT